jgi:hypothetical protein
LIIDIVEIGKMEIVSSTPICPSCRQIGQKVNQKTVSSLLNKKKSSLVTNKEYFICLSQDCPVAYYTQEGDFFNKNDSFFHLFDSFMTANIADVNDLKLESARLAQLDLNENVIQCKNEAI